MIQLLIAAIVGFIASFIGTNVGGGGMLILSTLILLGVPPHVAVATLRIGATGHAGAGLYRFNLGKKVDRKLAIAMALLGIIGSYFGANTLLMVPDTLLEKIIGILIFGTLAIFAFNKNVGVKTINRDNPILKALGYLAFAGLGFWIGLIGIGWGVFSIYILTSIFGKTMLESSGTQKLLGVLSSAVASIVFIFAGIINWEFAVVLVISMSLGSYMGASYGIKKGNKWVKTLFIIVTAIMALSLLI